MQFLLSFQILRALGWCVEYGNFFRVTPYRWNSKEKQLYIPLTGSGKRQLGYDWNVIKYITLVHQVFLIVRVGQSFWNPQIYELFLVVGVTVAFSVEAIIQITLIHRGVEIMHFVNRYIRWFLDIQGKKFMSTEIN